MENHVYKATDSTKFVQSSQSPKFKKVSLNESLEFPLWGLSISVDFDLEDLKPGF